MEVYRQNPADHVFVDVDAECQGKLLGNSFAAPDAIAPFHFNDTLRWPSRIRCASPEFSQLSSHQFDFSTRLDFTMKPLSLMPSSTLTEPPVGQHLASSSFQMGLEKVSVLSSKFPPRVSECSGSIFFSSASTAGRYFTLFGIPRSRMKYHSSIWPPLPDILELYPRTCLSPDFTISRRSIFVNGEKYMTGRNRPACLSTRSACRSPG